MFLRIQRERQDGAFFPSLGEYSKYFGLNKSILHNLKSNQYILHPGPVSLGVELDLESETSNQSLILNQVENGVAVRMSILETLLES
jgi:aspartate carbamoyltransferase catalytic subunit